MKCCKGSDESKCKCFMGKEIPFISEHLNKNIYLGCSTTLDQTEISTIVWNLEFTRTPAASVEDPKCHLEEGQMSRTVESCRGGSDPKQREFQADRPVPHQDRLQCCLQLAV